MTTLYNCRHAIGPNAQSDMYRITKFDDDMNVESSYICTVDECECPAGVRPTCRHRQMLPKFLARQHVGDEWFFDFDRGGWVQMGEEWKVPEAEIVVEGAQMDFIYEKGEASLEYKGLVTAEPEPPAPTVMKRRFL